MTCRVLAEKFKIKVAVFGIEKDVRPAIAALSNMVRHARNRDTTSSHGKSVIGRLERANRNGTHRAGRCQA
jgi:hypothetical protein